VASELEHQLSQLDELLGLLDSGALRSAQEAVENQIAELTERLEVTRQALAHAQAQRRRLARARLLLEEQPNHEPSNGNSDPALRPVPVTEAPEVDPSAADAPAVEAPAAASGTAQPLTSTAPFVAERRQSDDRRSNGERRSGEERRKNPRLP
jgi:hypothetical protein